MNNVYLLVAIAGAIGFLVAGVTGIIQAVASWPSIQQHHRKWLYVAIIAFFVVSVVSGGANYLTTRSSSTTTTSDTSSSPSNTTTTPNTISSPTAMPSPTPTPRVISENLQIPCTDCYSSGPISLELNKIVINVSQNKTLFYFTITNISNSDTAQNFAQMDLQSSEDASITSGEEDHSFPSWDLGPGNNIIHVTTFPFIPKNNVKYTLMIQTGFVASDTFQNESFTF